MYKIEGNHITLVRGDTFVADLEIYNPDMTVYTPDTGDVIDFAMKRTVADRKPLIKKTISTSELKLIINPEDTKNLEFGNYLYDITLTKQNGTVDTFIPVSTFTLAMEVS
jgi:hypothetical protein